MRQKTKKENKLENGRRKIRWILHEASTKEFCDHLGSIIKEKTDKKLPAGS